MAVTLHVCITCKAGQTVLEGQATPGKLLHEAIAESGAPEGVNVVPVECLSACNNGCSVALSAPGRWSYVYGRMSQDNAKDIVAGGGAGAPAPRPPAGLRARAATPFARARWAGPPPCPSRQ